MPVLTPALQLGNLNCIVPCASTGLFFKFFLVDLAHLVNVWQ